MSTLLSVFFVGQLFLFYVTNYAELSDYNSFIYGFRINLLNFNLLSNLSNQQ